MTFSSAVFPVTMRLLTIPLVISIVLQVEHLHLRHILKFNDDDILLLAQIHIGQKDIERTELSQSLSNL